MLLHDARRDARIDERGEIVLLEEQDRARWDRAQIAEGLAHSEAAIAADAHGPYAIQSAIAAVHSRAERADATDWRAIANLYARLSAIRPSPVIELNRAVAIAMADGPAARTRPDRCDSRQRRAARLPPDVVGARGFAPASGKVERGGRVVSCCAGARGQCARASVSPPAAGRDIGEDSDGVLRGCFVPFIPLSAGQYRLFASCLRKSRSKTSLPCTLAGHATSRNCHALSVCPL